MTASTNVIAATVVAGGPGKPEGLETGYYVWLTGGGPYGTPWAGFHSGAVTSGTTTGTPTSIQCPGGAAAVGNTDQTLCDRVARDAGWAGVDGVAGVGEGGVQGSRFNGWPKEWS